MPGYLSFSDVSDADAIDLKRGHTPALYISWHGQGVDSALSALAYKPPGVRLVQTRAQFDMDLGGERRKVEVDGVEGWLTYLGRDAFYPPDVEERFRAIESGWPEGASGLKSYSSILWNRHLPGQSNLDPSVDAPNIEGDNVEYLSIGMACDRPYVEFKFSCTQRKDTSPTYTLFGEAIALQWNREGVHYILIAQDIEPMNEGDLFKMANSLTRPRLPSVHDRGWLLALRDLLVD